MTDDEKDTMITLAALLAIGGTGYFLYKRYKSAAADNSAYGSDESGMSFVEYLGIGTSIVGGITALVGAVGTITGGLGAGVAGAAGVASAAGAAGAVAAAAGTAAAGAIAAGAAGTAATTLVLLA